jgi:hypothetical protein
MVSISKRIVVFYFSFIFILLNIIPPILGQNVIAQEKTKAITISLLGKKNISQQFNVSYSCYEHLLYLLKNVQDRCQNATSYQQISCIFRDAVNGLNAMHLLPSRISSQVAFDVVIPGQLFLKIKESSLSKSRFTSDDEIINSFCFLYANTIWAFEINFWSLVGFLFSKIYYNYGLKIFYWLDGLVMEYSLDKPFRFMNQIDVGVGTAYSYVTFGLKGLQKGSSDFHIADGFSGIKIILDYDLQKSVYIGFALRVSRYLPE